MSRLACRLKRFIRFHTVTRETHLLAYSRQSRSSREVLPFNGIVKESLRLLLDQKLFQYARIVQDLVAHEVLIQADKTQLGQGSTFTFLVPIAGQG